MAQLVRLQEQAAEFERIASRSNDAAKQELFTRLSERFLVLASEVEKAIEKSLKSNKASGGFIIKPHAAIALTCRLHGGAIARG